MLHETKIQDELQKLYKKFALWGPEQISKPQNEFPKPQKCMESVFPSKISIIVETLAKAARNR